MAAAWKLPSLVIICLVFIRGLNPLPTTVQVTGPRPTAPLQPRGFPPGDDELPPEEYYDNMDPVTTIRPKVVSPVGRTLQRCAFNPCVEDQTPCPQLAASTGCLCPGFTLHDTAPLAPTLTSVSTNSSGVVLRWCAPLSYVTSFVVTVGGQRRQVFGGAQRSGVVGYIDGRSEVCLVATNEAGESMASCNMFYPRSRSLPLTAGLVGGALGLLLLVLLAMLLWRHRKQRKQEASISVHHVPEPL